MPCGKAARIRARIRFAKRYQDGNPETLRGVGQTDEEPEEKEPVMPKRSALKRSDYAFFDSPNAA